MITGGFSHEDGAPSPRLPWSPHGPRRRSVLSRLTALQSPPEDLIRGIQLRLPCGGGGQERNGTSWESAKNHTGARHIMECEWNIELYIYIYIIYVIYIYSFNWTNQGFTKNSLELIGFEGINMD